MSLTVFQYNMPCQVLHQTAVKVIPKYFIDYFSCLVLCVSVPLNAENFRRVRQDKTTMRNLLIQK